jgi:hypothetical protein
MWLVIRGIGRGLGIAASVVMMERRFGKSDGGRHMEKRFRRIATAHDNDGRAILHSTDTLTPKEFASGVAEFALFWTTGRFRRTM